jgi:hypothetical protein
MQTLRTRIAAIAATILASLALATLATAQPYGGPAGFAPPGPPPPGYGAPIMNAANWVTVEESPGQVWDGIWTFSRSHHSMSAQWVNRATGQRVFARHMSVRLDGDQVTIIRPGSGNYTGRLSPDGRSIRGRLSWVPAASRRTCSSAQRRFVGASSPDNL